MADKDPILEQYRTDLIKVTQGNSERFEKQLSFISAGGLGLSLAFIKDIVGDVSHSKFLIALILSWLAMGATLLINLWSQVFANELTNLTISELEEPYTDYDPTVANKRRKQINNVNRCSIWTLLAGIVLLITYITINIYHGKSKETSIQTISIS